MNGSRAEDVKIRRDWKAEGENDHTNQATPDDSHQTFGRDWRAHPEDRDPPGARRDLRRRKRKAAGQAHTNLVRRVPPGTTIELGASRLGKLAKP
ncbi:MAG: hypothetical protein ACJ8FZ_04955 [Bradyrhizobium sp.]